MSELDDMLAVLDRTGADASILADQGIAHLMASGHRVLSRRGVAGLDMQVKELPDAIEAAITVAAGVRIAHPVHLCFGVMHARGEQCVRSRVRLEPGASAGFLAHCFFPYAERVRHIMDAVVEIGAGAELHYTEAHYHGPHGGIEVLPKAVVTVATDGRYVSDFSLLSGRVGKLDIDYLVDAGERAIVEMSARVFGHASDAIKIREQVTLAGAASRSLIKTRVALEDDATAEVTGITEGAAEGARGHVDCMEIVRDRAVATAVPVVKVTHPLAKVTHEAAIGRVDRHQLETLMAHGLSPEQAVDLIVRGLLR